MIAFLLTVVKNLFSRIIIESIDDKMGAMYGKAAPVRFSLKM
jgi:hypothetical protein